MAHYAHIEDGIVTQISIIKNEVIEDSEGVEQDSLATEFLTSLYGPKTYIKCSYNTYNGEHLLGGTPLRHNYPGVGWTYNSENDVFVEAKPFDSWTLNTSTWHWEPPVAMPDYDPENPQEYFWNEETQSWDGIDRDFPENPPPPE